MSLENYFQDFRENIIGRNQTFVGPFGEKKIIYADWVASGRLYKPIEKLLQKEPEKKKRLIHLICRIKGEKVYDEKKEIGEVEIKLEDVDMVINEILGKIKVETKDVL